jgi:hypothetical protein
MKKPLWNKRKDKRNPLLSGERGRVRGKISNMFVWVLHN